MAKKEKMPDWHGFEISEGIISFAEKKVHYIEFLDEGVKDTRILYPKTPQEKEVECINFSVIYEDKEIVFSPIAKKLWKTLEELYPLTGKIFRIELQQGRRDVDNIYLVKEVEQELK